MIAIVTILAAFPLGYFLRSHLAANTTYSIAYLWAFVFQTLYLSLDPKEAAFEAGTFPVAYGVISLAIFAAGFGIVALGRWVRTRRTVAEPVLS